MASTGCTICKCSSGMYPCISRRRYYVIPCDETRCFNMIIWFYRRPDFHKFISFASFVDRTWTLAYAYVVLVDCFDILYTKRKLHDRSRIWPVVSSSRYHVWRNIYRSIYQSLYLSIYLSLYRSLYVSIYHSIYVSIYLSLYVSIYLSLYLSIYLSLYLSITWCKW